MQIRLILVNFLIQLINTRCVYTPCTVPYKAMYPVNVKSRLKYIFIRKMYFLLSIFLIRNQVIIYYLVTLHRAMKILSRWLFSRIKTHTRAFKIHLLLSIYNRDSDGLNTFTSVVVTH